VINVKHKNYKKESLAEALFKKHHQSQNLFAWFIGSDPGNEGMHQLMKSTRNHYYILFNSDKFPLETHASHQLQDHRSVISLLEHLSGIKNPSPYIPESPGICRSTCVIIQKIVVCPCSFQLISQMM
jgi:hypothetical protein